MKFHQQPPIPGFDDFIRLLRVIEDPEMYRDHLDALDKRIAEINASISGRERLSQLDVLEAQAKADRTSAATQLRTATVEAERLVSEAKENARGIYEREELARVEAMRAVEAAQQEAEERKAKLDARESRIRSLEADLVAREEAAHELHEEALSIKQEYTDRIAALKQAMG